MARYQRIVTTEAGLKLLAAAVAGGTITFTAIKTGSGIYTGTEVLSEMTDLKNAMQTFGVSSITRTGREVKLRSVLNNDNLVEGYSMTEIGLYAKDTTGAEILYAIIIAETGFSDYLPPYELTPASITMELYLTLTETEGSVTFAAEVIAGTYVPVEDFNGHVSSEIHITAAERSAWNAKLDKTAKAADSDKLDGLDSLNFMRRVIGYGSSLFMSYDLNVWTIPGCYSCESSCINVPPGVDGWGDLLVFGGIGGRVTQIYRPWNKGKTLYSRSLNGETWEDWRNIASGGDADTLDGLHASAFLKLAGGIMSGIIDMNGQKIVGCTGNYAPSLGDAFSHAGLELREKDFIGNANLDIGYAPALGFHWSGAVGAGILMDASGNFHFVKSDGSYCTLKTGTANVIISDTAPADTTALWVS